MHVPFSLGTDRGWTPAIFRGFSPSDPQFSMPSVAGFDYFNDFRSKGVPSDEWTVTAVGSSTAVVNPLVNEIGELLLTTGASDGDGVQAQHLGCVVTPSTTKVIANEWRVKSVALTAQEFFYGVALTDTTVWTTADAVTTTDTIGFYSAGGDGVLSFGTNTSSAPTASSTSPGTMVADTYAKIGFRLEGNTLTGSSKIEVYYNGTVIANSVVAANIPNAALRLTFALATTTGAKVNGIDWVRMAVK